MIDDSDHKQQVYQSFDPMTPLLDNTSPDIKAFKGYQEESHKGGLRPHSKTVYQTQDDNRLTKTSSLIPSLTQTDEKLRKIDKIVFNQDKSHFAVIWSDGGFTKFDVATLSVIQKVSKAPTADRIYQDTGEPDYFNSGLIASTARSLRSPTGRFSAP